MNIHVFEQLGRIAVAIERSKCASPATLDVLES